MDKVLETRGRWLIRHGLFWVVVIACLSFVRSADEPWQAFAVVYLAAWAMVFGGMYLLKKAGAWPR